MATRLICAHARGGHRVKILQNVRNLPRSIHLYFNYTCQLYVLCSFSLSGNNSLVNCLYRTIFWHAVWIAIFNDVKQCANNLATLKQKWNRQLTRPIFPAGANKCCLVTRLCSKREEGYLSLNNVLWWERARSGVQLCLLSYQEQINPESWCHQDFAD